MTTPKDTKNMKTKVKIIYPGAFSTDWGHEYIPNIGDTIVVKMPDNTEMFLNVKRRYFYLDKKEKLNRIDIYAFQNRDHEL